MNSLLCQCELSQTSQKFPKMPPHVLIALHIFASSLKTSKEGQQFQMAQKDLEATYEIALEVQLENETFASAAGKIHSQKDAGCMCLIDLT